MEALIVFISSIVADVLCHLICKWLDQKMDEKSTKPKNMSAYCFRAYSYFIILYFNVKWTNAFSISSQKKKLPSGS